MRLIKDVAIFTTTELPKWNPINICSYHLQEAGATPVQELAFALATAIAVLDTAMITSVMFAIPSITWITIAAVAASAMRMTFSARTLTRLVAHAQG